MPSCFPWGRCHAVPESEPWPQVKTTNVLEMRSKRINQYRKGVKIGSGKFGEVYCCVNENTNEVVAMKIVKRTGPRDRLRLLRRSHQSNSSDRLGTTEHSIRREVAVLKACHHVHLVQLLEVIDDPKKDRICLVLEYLSGGQVQWADEDSKPLLFLDQTRRIIRDVVVGLEYLHFHGIIHRDIKPANLMWTSDRSTVKIIDFGVSQFVPSERVAPCPSGNHRYDSFKPLYDPLLFPPSDLTRRMGTPSFLAPELVWSFDNDKEPSGTSSDTLTSLASEKAPRPLRPPITKAIDIWSLAVTFYCLLFGHTPFSVPSSPNQNAHHNEFVLYNMICSQDWDVDETMGAERIPTGGRHPKDPQHEGFAVIKLLDQMLQKDPRRRLSLDQIKKHPWLLRDIVKPKHWLRDTAPLRAPPRPLSPEWFKTLF